MIHKKYIYVNGIFKYSNFFKYPNTIYRYINIRYLDGMGIYVYLKHLISYKNSFIYLKTLQDIKLRKQSWKPTICHVLIVDINIRTKSDLCYRSGKRDIGDISPVHYRRA